MSNNYDFRLWHRNRNFAVAISLLGMAAMGWATGAYAQISAEKTGEVAATLPFSTEANPNSGSEKSLIPKQVWLVVPRISLAETFTDNVAPTSGIRRSDQITEISPGIRLDSDGARLKFHLDYQVRELLYAQEPGRKNTQNYLNSFGTFEALENWLFLDIGGVVAQQEISPFGQQLASNANLNPNRVETSSFRASPYIRGNFSGYADYEMRYYRSSTQSGSALVADVDTEEWSGKIKGITDLAGLGWGLDGSHKSIDYSSARNTEADRLRALLSYQFNREFQVSVSGGQEANNYSTATKTSYDTYGYGFDWSPSKRTQVSAFREKRFFGDGHTVSIAHRTPLSALKFSDTRDVFILPNRFTTTGLGSIHDLIFAQLASSIPDPLERSRYVDNLLGQYGIPPNATATQGFFTSQISVQRRQELSYAIQGVRNVLTLSAIRSEYEAQGTLTGLFSTSPNIRQRGLNLNWSHRLTPLSSFNLAISQQNSSGSSGHLATELKTVLLGVSTRLGPKSTASLGARRTLFDSTNASNAAPYSENALIAALTALF